VILLTKSCVLFILIFLKGILSLYYDKIPLTLVIELSFAKGLSLS